MDGIILRALGAQDSGSARLTAFASQFWEMQHSACCTHQNLQQQELGFNAEADFKQMAALTQRAAMVCASPISHVIFSTPADIQDLSRIGM